MPPPEFQIFGSYHLVVMASDSWPSRLLLAAAARMTASKTVADAGAYLLAGTLLVNESIHWGYRLNAVGWSRLRAGPSAPSRLRNHDPVDGRGPDLPPPGDFTRSSISGDWSAPRTPSSPLVTWKRDFPDYRFFQYFIAHSGIVAGVLYATLGLKMRPTLARALPSVRLPSTSSPSMLGVLNSLLGSNYMYLCRPPAGTRIALLLRRMALVHPHHRPGRSGNVLRRLVSVPGEAVVGIPNASRTG